MSLSVFPVRKHLNVTLTRNTDICFYPPTFILASDKVEIKNFWLDFGFEFLTVVCVFIFFFLSVS